MQYLKQSTAAIVLVGPVLDADGAAVTGAVIGDFRLAKNGTVSTMAGNTIAHDHNGMYRITLTTSNTDTLDRLTISMGNTSYGMTAFRYTVLTENQYDALIANGTITPAAIEAALVNDGDATALLQAIADKIAGDLTAGDLTALAIVSAIKADATLAQMISRIDVATSSRLASASYTAPPTANQNRDAVMNAALVDYTSIGTVGAAIGAIKAATDNLPSDPADASVIAASFTEIKGAGWSSSTDTLEKIAESSGGGGTSIMVTPVVAQTPVRVVGSNIETFIGDLSDIRVGVFSGTDPVDLSTMGDLEVCVQLKSGVDLDLVSMADITIDGDDNNYFSWTPNGESVDAVRVGKWSLRKASNKQVIAYGAWIVVDAALSDAS